MSDKAFDGKRGVDLISDPALNKSTGFTDSEREKLGLVGLVPDVSNLARVERPADLEAFIRSQYFSVKQFGVFFTHGFSRGLALSASHFRAGDGLNRELLHPQPRLQTGVSLTRLMLNPTS